MTMKRHDPEVIARVLADPGTGRQAAERHGVAQRTVDHWRSGNLPRRYLDHLAGVVRVAKPKGGKRGPPFGNQNWRGGKWRPDRLAQRHLPPADRAARFLCALDARAGR